MDDYTRNFVTLLDEQGKEHHFELLDIIEDEGEKFFALLPKEEQQKKDLCCEDVYGYYIFQELNTGKENVLAEVEDPVKLEKISNLLEERLGNTEYEFS